MSKEIIVKQLSQHFEEDVIEKVYKDDIQTYYALLEILTLWTIRCKGCKVKNLYIEHMNAVQIDKTRNVTTTIIVKIEEMTVTKRNNKGRYNNNNNYYNNIFLLL